MLSLFGTLYHEYDGEIPGEILEDDENVIPAKLRRGPATKMPDGGFIDPEAARWSLFALHARAVPMGNWRVPALDVWVPATPTVLYQLDHLVARGPSKGRCVSVEPANFPNEVMNKFLYLVAALETQVELLARESATWVTRRMSLEYARRVVFLTSWHWENHPSPPGSRADALTRLRVLAKAIEDIENAADALSLTRADEQKAANDLLTFLAPTSAAAPAIKAALVVIATQPTAFRAEEINVTFEIIERAVLALSASSGAETFVTDHLISLVQLMSESLAPELENMLMELPGDGGDEWKSLCGVGWQEAMVALRAEGGVNDNSPLEPLVMVGTYYKSGLAVIQAGMNHGTLPILLARLAAAGGAKTSNAAFQPLARSLAVCMLRGLLASGALHRGSAGVLLFAGQDVTKWFKACVRALGGKSVESSMAEMAGEIKALKLGDEMGKTRLLGAAAFFFSAVSTLAACDATWDDTWQNWTKLLSSAMKTTADLAKLGQIIQIQDIVDVQASELTWLAERLGIMAGIITLIATGGDTLASWSYLSRQSKIAKSLATISAATALLRLLPLVKASARWTRVLGWVGFALGIVEFGVGVVITARTPGTQNFFNQYLQFAFSGQPYRQGALSSEFSAVNAAADRVREGGFVVLGDRGGVAGEPGVVPTGELPTWYFAYSMGFPAEVVAKLFGTDVMDVVRAGLLLGPGFDEDGAIAPGEEGG